MALTPTNAAMGPGTVYVGLFGATEPTGMAAPGVGFTDVGGTLGGTKVSFEQASKELEFDQLTMPVGYRRTKTGIIVKVTMAEVTLSNFKIAMNDGTLTSASGYTSYTPDVSALNTGTEPTYRAVIVDGAGIGGETRRLIVRKVFSTDNVELEYTKDGQQVFAVTFTGMYVSSSIAPYETRQTEIGS